MALEVNRDIKVDFYDKNYILINAKQYDKNSRFITVICYNQGKLIKFNDRDHSAFVRYKKADDCSVFNSCEITTEGKIKIKLTEQMLASAGVCYVDLVIVNKDKAYIDADTKELNIDGDEVLSTSTFCVDVSETATENSKIESSPEYGGLSELLVKAEADYQDVVRTSESWAVGGTGKRNDEDTNNSKYWAEQSKSSSESAKSQADKSDASATKASEHMNKALEYMGKAETYMRNAESSMNSASGSATASAESAKSSSDSAKAADDSSKLAKASEEAASNSETEAKKSENAAAQSKNAAATSETNASNSADNALNSANRAQSYTVGGTGTRDGEDTNNAQWYYNEIKDILNGLNIVFVPKGTIYFSELATVKETAVPGYIYNIKDDFVTDDSFREGSGATYTAGTNVYYVIDENGEYKWDCFGGAASPVAAVEDVKDYLGINEEIVIG